MSTVQQKRALQSENALIVTIISWLVVGGLIGWGVTLSLRTAASQPRILVYIAAGVLGAAIGGCMLSALIGFSAKDQIIFGVPSLLLASFGAAIAVSVVNLALRVVPKH